MGFFSNKINLLLSLFFAFLATYFLSNNGILYAVIVFGQAHFLIAYYYRYRNVGFSEKYLNFSLALLFLCTILSVYIFFNREWYNLFVLVTLVIFVVHYFNDEFKLSGFYAIKNKIFGTYAVALAFLSLFLTKLYNINILIALLLFFISSVFVIFFTKNLFLSEDFAQRRKESYFFYVFFLLHIVAPFFLVFQEDVLNYQISGFIILLHYIRWYLFYFEKFKDGDLRFYLNIVITINFFIVILFIACAKLNYFSFLYVLFDPTFFYGWTLLHIFLSVRKSDYILKLNK